MSAPPQFPPAGFGRPPRPARDSTVVVCAVIGAVSLVFALVVGGSATKKSNSAAFDRDAASAAGSDASSSASVAASLPSPASVRDGFPRPPGAFTKPEDEPNRGSFFYYTRGLTAAQVKTFYTREIPRRFPALRCRFTNNVGPDNSPVNQECALRDDVDFGEVDVWTKVDGLQPGEIFIRLTLTGLS